MHPNLTSPHSAAVSPTPRLLVVSLAVLLGAGCSDTNREQNRPNTEPTPYQEACTDRQPGESCSVTIEGREVLSGRCETIGGRSVCMPAGDAGARGDGGDATDADSPTGDAASDTSPPSDTAPSSDASPPADTSPGDDASETDISEGEDYEVIEVAAGETFEKTLSAGETWENKLIDITADKASVTINAHTDDWTIRNIGVRGEYPDRDNGQSRIIAARVNDPNSTGTIENVYFGDGAVGTDFSEKPGSKSKGIYVDRLHAGHIDIERIYLAGFPDNCIYASNAGNPESHQRPGKGGTITIDTAFGERCGGGAAFRLGTTGSAFVNAVAVDGYDRGFWAYYQDVECRNCDASGHPINYCAKKGATLNVTDSRGTEAQANWEGSCNGTVSGDLGSNPRTDPPQGVPTSPEEAASGR